MLTVIKENIGISNPSKMQMHLNMTHKFVIVKGALIYVLSYFKL